MVGRWRAHFRCSGRCRSKMALAIISGQRRIRSVVGFASGIELRGSGDQDFIRMADGIMPGPRPGVGRCTIQIRMQEKVGELASFSLLKGWSWSRLLLRLAWFAVHP